MAQLALLKAVLKITSIFLFLYWLFRGRKKWERRAAGFLRQFAEMFLERVNCASINPTGLHEEPEITGYLGEQLIHLRQLDASGTRGARLPQRMLITKSPNVSFSYMIFRRRPWWHFGFSTPLHLDTREADIGAGPDFRVLVDAQSSGTFSDEQKRALCSLIGLPRFELLTSDSIDGLVIRYDGYIFGRPEPARSASVVLKEALPKV